MEPKKVSNYLFLGCIILGTAAGLFYGRPDVGALAGVGVGFLVKAVYLHGNK